MLILLSLFTLTAHLLAMNLATAGPLLAAVLQIAWHNDPGARRLTAELTRWSIAALLLGVLLGAGQAAVAWLDHGPYLLKAFELLPVRRYWFGAAEIVFSWFCLAWYVRRLKRVADNDAPLSRWWLLLPIAAGTNLAYHFPPLFTILGVYSTRPTSWDQPLSFVAALGDAEVLGHWLHFLIASCTVAGLALAWLSRRHVNAAPSCAGIALLGGRLALGATVLQLISGLQLLAVVDDRARDALLGGELAATGGLAVALFATVALLHRLANLALVEFDQDEVLRAAMALFVVVLGMVSGLQATRRVLRRQLPTPTAAVTPDARPAGFSCVATRSPLNY